MRVLKWKTKFYCVCFNEWILNEFWLNSGKSRQLYESDIHIWGVFENYWQVFHQSCYKVSLKYLFFLENALKKFEYFLKFLFLFESTIPRLVMENNFILMAASAGHAVGYTNVPTFKHIIDCMPLYFTNGFTNIVVAVV